MGQEDAQTDALPEDENLPIRPEPMRVLSLDQIVDIQDLDQETLYIPEWGGSVVIRGLGYSEWMDLRGSSMIAGEVDELLLTKGLIAQAMVEPTVSPEQADLLMGKSSAAVNRLIGAIFNLSNLGEEAVAQAEAMFRGG
jgi:hypothetical protein